MDLYSSSHGHNTGADITVMECKVMYYRPSCYLELCSYYILSIQMFIYGILSVEQTTNVQYTGYLKITVESIKVPFPNVVNRAKQDDFSCKV